MRGCSPRVGFRPGRFQPWRSGERGEGFRLDLQDCTGLGGRRPRPARTRTGTLCRGKRRGPRPGLGPVAPGGPPGLRRASAGRKSARAGVEKGRIAKVFWATPRLEPPQVNLRFTPPSCKFSRLMAEQTAASGDGFSGVLKKKRARAKFRAIYIYGGTCIPPAPQQRKKGKEP